MSATPVNGRPLSLSLGLALLSYVPFEWVAKGTLVLCALLFVFDPFPPLSRLVALISLLTVAFLARLRKDYQHDGVDIVDESRQSPSRDEKESSSKKDD
jgi:hypothetical protein